MTDSRQLYNHRDASTDGVSSEQLYRISNEWERNWNYGARQLIRALSRRPGPSPYLRRRTAVCRRDADGSRPPHAAPSSRREQGTRLLHSWLIVS
ncbi:hypothetical protein EVAR_86970_1 [Eumeta japonica]|uniref:Uncharacterized protein n=1 Tax=Eumeta variegata TaxID=151549 RepID=A0A4C1W9B8_EUMVA|nr:hypothetical protein EVAR_86970_1 [Eumeta japonica]